MGRVVKGRGACFGAIAFTLLTVGGCALSPTSQTELRNAHHKATGNVGDICSPNNPLLASDSPEQKALREKLVGIYCKAECSAVKSISIACKDNKVEGCTDVSAVCSNFTGGTQ